MNAGITAINEEVERASAFVQPLLVEMGKVVVGQKMLVERLIIGLLANGHVLLEGVPGLAKTLSIKSLANCMDAQFSRGCSSHRTCSRPTSSARRFTTRNPAASPRGRARCSPTLVLADEINRAPAKVQSALLEAMQERQVTIGDKTYPLPEPFLVMATQNPIDQEGTYPLPEAQIDRFMLKVKITHPDRDEERQILDLMGRTNAAPETQQVVTVEDILKAREVINSIYTDDKVKDYIVDMVCCTRDPERYGIDVADFIQLGASPRATIALTLTAKAHAFLRGRGFVTPQDVKSVAQDVLRHRVSVTFEAEAEEKNSETIIQKILDELPVP